jgi:hypothetical protein
VPSKENVPNKSQLIVPIPEATAMNLLLEMKTSGKIPSEEEDHVESFKTH